MNEKKLVELTVLVDKAIELCIEMTNPQIYQVLTKKEHAFIHHTISYFNDNEDIDPRTHIFNFLNSAKEMYIHNLSRRKNMNEKELEFFKMLVNLQGEANSSL